MGKSPPAWDPRKDGPGLGNCGLKFVEIKIRLITSVGHRPQTANGGIFCGGQIIVIFADQFPYLQLQEATGSSGSSITRLRRHLGGVLGE